MDYAAPADHSVNLHMFSASRNGMPQLMTIVATCQPSLVYYTGAGANRMICGQYIADGTGCRRALTGARSLT
jgi:hypothetical protein